MISIVYSSTAVTPFDDDDLVSLLKQSRESNRRDGLTGLLVYRDGRFLQLIEGPDDAVHALMARIEDDARHDAVRVLLEDAVDERQFPDWSMGYERLTDPVQRVPGYRRSFDDIDADRSSTGTLPALRALIGWYRERHDEVAPH